MTIYFLDASALAKRYLTELGSPWISQLSAIPTDNTIFIAEITQVEVAAAIAARHRAPNGITRQQRDVAVDLLARHMRNQYQLVAMTKIIIARAVRLTQSYRLRGYDAVQLATGLVTHESFVAGGLRGLIFVAADSDLLKAASAEGLPTDNPNQYG